jgi:hypothetical protein
MDYKFTLPKIETHILGTGNMHQESGLYELQLELLLIIRGRTTFIPSSEFPEYKSCYLMVTSLYFIYMRFLYSDNSMKKSYSSINCSFEEVDVVLILC